MIDPEICFPDERTGAHAIGGSLEQLFALVHDDDVVRQTHDQIDVVLDQEDGDATREGFDQRVEFSRFGRRHSLRGLVEHQQPGSERHADGDLDPALIAMGEISNELVRPLLQPELLENGSSTRLRPGQAIQANEIATAPFKALAREANVLECAQAKKQIRDLKGSRDAEPRQRKGRLSGDVAPVQLDRSSDEIERGALAGSIRTYDGCHTTGKSLETEISHGAQPAERLVESAHLDHGAAFSWEAERRRASPIKPSGRNMTNTMKMTPRTSRCLSVWLPTTDSRNVTIKLPASGPSSVPTPPTSDITTALVETSNPKRCGATNPRSNG